MRFKSLLGIGVAFFILVTGCSKGKAEPSSNLPETRAEIKNISGTSTKPPSVVVPESTYEFPAVVDGVKVTHEFTVYNKGKGDLEINRVKTG